MLKAFIIDPRLQTISEVSYPQITFREINAAIGSRSMDMGFVLPTGDLLWVDDEGMLKADTENGDCTFVLGGSPLLFGRGLLTGPEDEVTGNIVDVKSTIDNLQSTVLWQGRKRLVGFDVHDGTINHPIFGRTRSIKRTPILKEVR